MEHRVAIVGAALSDCGRVDTKSPFELHYQAASRAIADAGLTKDDIDGFGSTGMGLLAPVEIAEYLGLRPTWADGTGVGGSTWEFMVEHAAAAISAGHAQTVVLVYGSTARADLKARRRGANLSFGTRGPVQFDAMNPGNSAPGVAWLASDESKPTTGQVIRLVGNSICVYSPWEMGEQFFATDAEGNPARWEAGDIGPILNKYVFRSINPGIAAQQKR